MKTMNKMPQLVGNAPTLVGYADDIQLVGVEAPGTFKSALTAFAVIGLGVFAYSKLK